MHQALCFGEQPGKQVQRVNLRIASVGGKVLRRLHGLLGLDGQFVESKCHDEYLSMCAW